MRGCSRSCKLDESGADVDSSNAAESACSSSGRPPDSALEESTSAILSQKQPLDGRGDTEAEASAGDPKSAKPTCHHLLSPSMSRPNDGKAPGAELHLFRTVRVAVGSQSMKVFLMTKDCH